MNYLFAGYTVIWVALAAYLFLQGKRQKELKKEVRLLMELVDETGGASIDVNGTRNGNVNTTTQIGF